jgi:hypothetical protein
MTRWPMKARWCLLAVAVSSAAYVSWVFCQPTPSKAASDELLGDAVVFGMVSLILLSYDLLPPSLHGQLTCVWLGLGAVVASICSALLGRYLWRVVVSQTPASGVAFLVGLLVVFGGVSALAWWCFATTVRETRQEQNHRKL